VVTGLRAAKNMRWRDPRLAFTRPIRWLLALWGDDVVPVRASTLATGRTTWVLRSAVKPVITVGAAEEYLDHLHTAGILLDPAARRDRIAAAAAELAATVSGCIDTGGESALIEALTYLIESPTPLLGRFDPDYLRLPEARAGHRHAQASALPAGPRRSRRAAALLRRGRERTHRRRRGPRR
jgi:glycyl-tRNA synthetase